MKSLLIALALSLISNTTTWAEDPDLQYILDALTKTPCSQAQVLVAKNIGVIRWSRMSMRYLYGADIAPLRDTALKSGKRVIAVDREFKIPTLNDPDVGAVDDQLVTDLTQIFEADFQAHLPDGC